MTKANFFKWLKKIIILAPVLLLLMNCAPLLYHWPTLKKKKKTLDVTTPSEKQY